MYTREIETTITHNDHEALITKDVDAERERVLWTASEGRCITAKSYWTGWTGADKYTLDKFVKSVKAVLDAQDKEAKWSPIAKPLAQYLPPRMNMRNWGTPASEREVNVGDIAWVDGVSRYRQGVVTKVGPKRIEVAYYVKSSGVLRFASRPKADVYVTSRKVDAA